MSELKKRLLALDVGDARIGVAVTDPLGITAQPVETIWTSGWSKDIKRIGELLEMYDTDRLVVGLPASLNGTLGPQAQKVMTFCEQLTAKGWQVQYQDERLTTVQAQRTLIDGNVRREKRKNVVDKVAAVYILESFLASGGWKEEKEEKEEENLPNVTDTEIWHKARKEKEYTDMTENNFEDSSMEFDNIIELEDEDGKTVKFELVAGVPYKGQDYVLLAPVEPVGDMADDEVLILRIDTDANGDEVYASVDDDETVQKVFEEYLKLVENDDE